MIDHGIAQNQGMRIRASDEERSLEGHLIQPQPSKDTVVCVLDEPVVMSKIK